MPFRLQNDRRRWAAGQPLLAGIVTAVVGFTSSFTVVLAGLHAVGANRAQAASGLLAVCLACGILAALLGMAYRQPISIAWSTPGAALLATAGPQPGGFSAVVGAFLLSGTLVVVAGLVTPLGRLVAAIPGRLAAAMLAGVLLPLCLAPVQALATVPLLTAPVIVVWALVSRFAKPWAVPAALTVAVVAILTQGRLPASATVAPALTATLPTWQLGTLVGVGLPLFVVTMVSQNVTGMAILAQYDVHPPWRPVLLMTGLGSLAAAPFGGHAVNLAAISAALAAGPDAGPPPRRWIASVTAGVLLAGFGLTAGLATAVLATSPPVLVEAVAGLALLGALGSALRTALDTTERSSTPDREAALVTFIVTAAGTSFVGLGSAFWGLLAGLAMTLLHRHPHPGRCGRSGVTDGYGDGGGAGSGDSDNGDRREDEAHDGSRTRDNPDSATQDDDGGDSPVP